MKSFMKNILYAGMLGVLAAFFFLSCGGGGGGGNPPGAETYTYTSGRYVLTITKTISGENRGSLPSIYPYLNHNSAQVTRAVLSAGETASYTLKYDGLVKSTGQVLMGTTEATFKPASGKTSFTGTFSGDTLGISGPVTADDGTPIPLSGPMGLVTGNEAAFAEYWGVWNTYISDSSVSLIVGDGEWKLYIDGGFDSSGIYTQTSATTASITRQLPANLPVVVVGQVTTGANTTMTITLNSNSYYPGTYTLTR